LNKTILTKPYTLIFSVLISLILVSCTKEPESIGLDVQPPSDRLGTNFTDTTHIIAYSVLEDSIVTSALSQNVVGYVNDPYFGTMSAGFVTQFNLPSRDVHFDNNPVLDSVVLVVGYRGLYGDTTSGVNFKVYELSQDIYKDSTYYQNSTYSVYSKPLNYNPSQYHTTQISTPVISPTDTTGAQFRIRLSTRWGQTKIFNKSNQPEISSNDLFKAYFKGLYITAEDARGLGHLVYLGINKSTTSGVYFYYHNDSETSQVFRILVEDDCARANQYNHRNYSTASIQIRNQVINHDTSLGANQLYLHPGGGINTYVKFPTVREQFKNRRVVINRAELVITNLIPNMKGFYVPAQITLVANSSTGTYLFLPDDAFTEGSDYFGGIYNSTTNEYRFRITRYIQHLINSTDEDYGLTMLVSGRAVFGNRLIFAGYHPNISLSKNKPFRLELSYTYLD
jgi:hypothetical protein